MRVIGPINTGICAGGAGTSTNNGTGDAYLTGLVLGVYVRYNDSPPAATTDLTIATVANSVPARNILVLTNGATTGYYPLMVQSYDAAGAATGQYTFPPVVNQQIKVTIAQANDGDSADVWLYLVD